MANVKSLDHQRSKINALGQVFAKTDRILTGNKSITVAVKPIPAGMGIPDHTPAYSNGVEIVINLDRLGSLGSKQTLMNLQALNFHELCHIMYTPRKGSNFRQWVTTNGYQMTHNILEDQRIETLFTAVYKPARHYFVNMVLTYIMADKKMWERAHVLMHGRRYMPKAIRDEFARRWFDQPSAAEVASIIDDYRLLDMTDYHDQVIAKTCIERLDTILNHNLNQKKELEEDSDCHSNEQSQGLPDSTASSSAAEKAKEETKEQDEKEKAGEDGSNFWDDSEDDEETDEEEGTEDDEEDVDGGEDDEESDKSSGQGDDEDSEEDGSDDSDGSGAGAGDSDDDDSDVSEGDSDSDTGEGDDVDSEDSDGEDATGFTGSGMTETELSEELSDVLNAISENEQIEEDTRILAGAMNDPNNFDLDAESAETTLIDVPPHIQSAAKRVSDEFRRLYAEMEPGWLYGSDEGRLNVGRAIMSDDPETIFDQWDEGRQESAGLELVIALDISGSMNSYYNYRTGHMGVGVGTPIEAACYSAWILKKSCEELGATVSVVGFGEGASTIIPRHNKSLPTKAVYVDDLEGSTQPAEAFAIARWIMAESAMPHKLFVVITDGVWDDVYRSSRYVSQSSAYPTVRSVLEQVDATKVYLGIGQPLESQYEGCFDIARMIGDAQEIVPVVKSAIENMVRSR